MGGAICSICDSFTDLQCEMPATHQYQIRKDKKAGLFVSPKIVTVLGSTNDVTEEEVRLAASTHAQPVASTSTGGLEFVSKQDFDKLSSQLDERSARFEALLNRGNIFTTHKIPVNVVPPPVYDRPFIDPSVVQATDPLSAFYFS